MWMNMMARLLCAASMMMLLPVTSSMCFEIPLEIQSLARSHHLPSPSIHSSCSQSSSSAFRVRLPELGPCPGIYVCLYMARALVGLSCLNGDIQIVNYRSFEGERKKKGSFNIFHIFLKTQIYRNANKIDDSV